MVHQYNLLGFWLATVILLSSKIFMNANLTWVECFYPIISYNIWLMIISVKQWVASRLRGEL